MMLQLNPSIPVEVVGKGSAECVGWIDYHPETDLIWICALDSNGEIWLAPNSQVRFLKNWSLGRTLDDIKK